jgi:tRNA-(ms[2]io[6]A)-hydroxylase
LIADALDDPALKKFYQSIARSEQRHYELFLDMAKLYISTPVVEKRWHELLDIEADIVKTLPIQAALH